MAQTDITSDRDENISILDVDANGELYTLINELNARVEELQTQLTNLGLIQ